MEHAIERDFEEFFTYCETEQLSGRRLQRICYPLTWRMRVRRAKRWAMLAGVALLLYPLYTNVDAFAWSVSAVYRLALMQLLPLWNWVPLYNARCVLERRVETRESAANGASYTNNAPDDANCVLCETLEHVARVANVTFATLESRYLERGHPVIVADSHRPQTLDHLLHAMLHETANYLSHDPCDVLTNLMLPKFFDVELALQKLREQATQRDRWFLRLRNCRASAVKASRRFFARPYFYPRQLEPFYTSWLLVSHNYDYTVPQTSFRLVGNLIVVVQLAGSFHMQLQPRSPCVRSCPEVNVQLEAGESLLFTTDLWTFGYEAFKRHHTAAAALLEIDWQL